MNNILLIAPMFYSYEAIIKDRLELKYDKVIYQNEIPFNSPYKFFALRRISKSLADIALRRYNKSLCEIVTKNNISTILIIKGYGLLDSFFDWLVKEQPQVKIINYQWDAIAKNPNSLMISKFAKYNFTFDPGDVKHYTQFSYLPLFYTWDTIPNNMKSITYKQNIDVLFIGSLHSERDKIVSYVKEYCKNNGLNMYSHIYIPFLVYLRLILSGEPIGVKGLKFYRLKRCSFYKLLSRSNIVLDVQFAEQTGATMRTIETLSLKKKLLTTNKSIRHEEFYSGDNIEIWDGRSPLDLNRLLNSTFDTTSFDRILDLDNWINKILECSDENTRIH